MKFPFWDQEGLFENGEVSVLGSEQNPFVPKPYFSCISNIASNDCLKTPVKF